MPQTVTLGVRHDEGNSLSRYVMRVRNMSIRQARAASLGAQGLLGETGGSNPNRGHLRRTVDQLGVLQIDAVNAVARSHHLVLRARMGAHDEKVLERSYAAGDLLEYWAHEASFIPIADQPLYRWRMARAEDGEVWSGIAKFARDKAPYVQRVIDEITERGALAAGDISEGHERRGQWWGWGDSKLALEWLFWIGRVTVSRRQGFTRLYDLTERVVPDEILSAATPSETDAHKELLVRAAGHLGVGAANDLADYHRLPKRAAKARIAELVEDGRLEKVNVEGWNEPGFTQPGVSIPRRSSRSVLLSPFDPIVWCRPRAERLHEFKYRLEIYTPEPKRRYGYYVLPFLHDSDLVGRLDVRADRKASVLRVPGAYAELGPHHPELGSTPDAQGMTEALGDELTRMAEWLQLDNIKVGARGDLAEPLLRRFAPIS
jgi:uncharacterized protein